MNENNNFKLDSVELFVFLLKNKMPILVVTALGCVVSVIVSFVITPKYKSSVIMYPTSSASISKELLTDVIIMEKTVMGYGKEEETEQLLQCLYSYDIRNAIIKKFDLMNHYKIDPNSAYPLTKLGEEFEDNIKFKKTEYEAVEIRVLDSDPKIAADIANEIAAQVDTVINKMKKERALKALALVESEYNDEKRNLQMLEDSLSKLSSNGSVLPDAQTSQKNKVIGNVTRRTTSKAVRQTSVSSQITLGTQRLALLNAKYHEAQVDVKQNLPNRYIVNYAVPSEKKFYPVKWLIVSISTISSFLLSIFLVMFFDFYKRIRVAMKNNSLNI